VLFRSSSLSGYPSRIWGPKGVSIKYNYMGAEPIPIPKPEEKILSLPKVQGLTQRQKKAVEFAATGMTWVEVEHKLGLRRKTLHAWRHQQLFMHEFVKARNKYLEEATITAREDFQSLEPLAISALRAALETSSNRALKAAIAVLTGRGYFKVTKEEPAQEANKVKVTFGLLERIEDLDGIGDAAGGDTSHKDPA